MSEPVPLPQFPAVRQDTFADTGKEKNLNADTQEEDRALLRAALRLYVHHCQDGYRTCQSDEMRAVWKAERDAAETVIRTLCPENPIMISAPRIDTAF